jgi:uncharacterized protein YbbC (DUF1343 family)
VSGLNGLLTVLAGRRAGLCSGPTGWLGAAGHLAQVLADRGQLAALYAPEHGVWGDLQAGEQVPDGRDPRTGCRVFSLYGAATRPTPEMLAGVEVLVGCLQDAGARPYTYAATLAGCLRAAAEAGLPMIILDRPTPLGGAIQAGNVAAGPFFPIPTPMRPGLTIGEHLRLLAYEQALDVDLTVVPLWRGPRHRWYDETGLPWVAPSPNLPTLASALCFAATVVLEGCNLSEGRGTTRPFELLGAPWCDGPRLAAELTRRGLPGAAWRPVAFVPTFSKHRGQVCRGVQLHVTDRLRFDAPRTGLHLLDAARATHPDHFQIDAAALDARYHTAEVRVAWEGGAAPDDLAAGWRAPIESFRQRCAAAGVGGELS